MSPSVKKIMSDELFEQSKNLTAIFGLYINRQMHIDSYIHAYISTCTHTAHAVLVIIERLVY